MRWFLVPMLGLFALWVMSVERARADDGCPADRPHARYVVEGGVTVCETLYRLRLVCPSELVPGDTPKMCRYVDDTVCSQPSIIRTICLSDGELRAAQK